MIRQCGRCYHTITTSLFREFIRPLLLEGNGIGVATMDTPNGRDFGWALYHLRRGQKVQRLCWRREAKFVSLLPFDIDKAQAPVLCVTVHGQQVPWVSSVFDLLAEDWVIHGE